MPSSFLEPCCPVRCQKGDEEGFAALIELTEALQLAVNLFDRITVPADGAESRTVRPEKVLAAFQAAVDRPFFRVQADMQR